MRRGRLAARCLGQHHLGHLSLRRGLSLRAVVYPGRAVPWHRTYVVCHCATRRSSRQSAYYRSPRSFHAEGREAPRLGPGEGAPGPLRPQLLHACSDGLAAASDVSQPASPAAATKSSERALTGGHLYGAAAASSALTGGAGTCGGVPTGGPGTCHQLPRIRATLGVPLGPADGIDLGGSAGSAGGGSCGLPPPPPGTPPMRLRGPGGPVQHPMQMQIQIPMQTPVQTQGMMQFQMAGGGGAAQE
ncbi:hypothetical protein HYH03_014007 [Edaphochlamys debaryana]|uniref:Uncharacterized protein n=1 Tax=Edaphochlamys debaryana TaxID=47281 RepID=A0A835XPU8_9CHLO|nr:hypothetical protein HYH03_014007 [Edaphochlamys debaryana]|eukprot:KAG2487440.1 hypothetical protein HYH03_014007 [Edaphochlamys debaryana]